ncbi:MAG: proline dehydrogenase family protein [Terriglobia bacterium]
MPLRRTLLYLSRHPALRGWTETSPLARSLSSRFVAGSTLEEAIAVCIRLRAEGITTTLDYLGEHVKSPGEAQACRDMYLRMLHAMRAAAVEPNVSVKLSQFGIDISASECVANVELLVGKAAEVGGFVRIDMESSAYTERTLEIAARLHERYAACGVVIQSYLYRSGADVAKATAQGMRIRLCKGAYLESSSVAYETKAQVDHSYATLAGYLLSADRYPAIATHDERIIQTVRRFADRHGIGRDRFEFQMLYGIRRDLQKQLVDAGYRLRLYVPFGEAWYPYFMRRLAERPANLLFLARNLLKR